MCESSKLLLPVTLPLLTASHLSTLPNQPLPVSSLCNGPVTEIPFLTTTFPSEARLATSRLLPILELRYSIGPWSSSPAHLLATSPLLFSARERALCTCNVLFPQRCRSGRLFLRRCSPAAWLSLDRFASPSPSPFLWLSKLTFIFLKGSPPKLPESWLQQLSPTSPRC